MDQEYWKNMENNLIGRRISVIPIDPIFVKNELTGRIVRFLENASPLLLRSKEILLSNTFIIELDEPIEYEGTILESKKRRILTHVVIVAWDINELSNLIKGGGDGVLDTISMHLYILKNGISPQKKNLTSDDMHGIAKDIEVKLL